jgi:Holliday junction resolvase RusA-like endonuclease
MTAPLPPLSPMPFGISFVVPGQAVQFARAGSRGTRRFTPKRQADHMAVIKMLAAKAMDGTPPISGPVEMRMRVEYLVPPSWPKKKRAAAKWKASAPDADNLAKIAKDAMNKIVFVDDAQVASLIVQKVFSEFARTTISVIELPEGAVR